MLLNHLASNIDDTALWIDTTCDFSPERAAQLLDAKQMSPSILERLKVSLAFDINTIQGMLEDLSQSDVVRSSAPCPSISDPEAHLSFMHALVSL